MKQGFAVSFEGIEKCGKDTQVGLLSKFLEAMDVAFTVGHEPGGTSHGEIERRILKDPNFFQKINAVYPDMPKLAENELLGPEAELFSFMKSRAQFFRKVVKPVIDRNELYVLNRSGDSTTAYQGFGHFNGAPEIIDFIRRNNEFAMAGVKIARTYFLDITVEEMHKRKDHDEYGTGKDIIEQRRDEYFNRVRNGYLWVAEQEPQRYLVIGGTRDITLIQRQIAEDITLLLGKYE